MPSTLLNNYSKITNSSALKILKGTGGADGAGAAFNVGDWVYVNSSGNVRWADSSTGITNPAIGIVYKVWDNYLIVLSSGSIKISGWGLTPDVKYYLGATGAMTSTAPSAGGSIVQFLGRAVSSTQFLINILDDSEN